MRKKFISWNVNGLRAVMGKGFMDFFKAVDADAFCLQETKLQKGQIEMDIPGYYEYWDYAEKKGYSGTAVFVKEKPLNVIIGLPKEIHNKEGRCVCLEYDNYYLLTVYVPNSQNELQRLDYRMQWEDDWREYICELNKKKPVIYCGDLNVAFSPIDLKNDKTNHHNAGFTDEERAKFAQIKDSGFIDSFRYLHPDSEEYSWWSYRMNARAKNVGWRIDYFMVSDKLKENIKAAWIEKDVLGSDHAPIGLEIEV